MVVVRCLFGACAFEKVREAEDHIIIRDLANEDSSWKSVTNGAEEVVAALIREEGCANKRIYYYDTEGRLDELAHDGQSFTGFKPGGPDQ
jgi:hypothetical protein